MVALASMKEPADLSDVERECILKLAFHCEMTRRHQYRQ